ncbi:MAG: hypothetical protein LBI60_04070 [Bacteroidales bacterium]|jgi:hypothetical protein|nr:hypothetical protein [Bacteroidales bacterium]
MRFGYLRTKNISGRLCDSQALKNRCDPQCQSQEKEREIAELKLLLESRK